MEARWLIIGVGISVGLVIAGIGVALAGGTTLLALRRYAAALPSIAARSRVPLARRVVAALARRQAEFDATLWIAHWSTEDAVARLQQLWLVLAVLAGGLVLLAKTVVPNLSPFVLGIAAAAALGIAAVVARVVLVWQVRAEARIARQRIDNSLANLALLIRVYVQGGASATEALTAISELRGVMSEAGARDVDAWIQGSQRNDQNIGAVLERFGNTYGVPRIAQLGSYLEQSILSGRPVSDTLDVAIRDAYQALFESTVAAVNQRVRIASLVFIPGVIAIGVVFMASMIASMHGIGQVTKLFGGGGL